MKKHFTTIMFIAAGLVMTACGNKAGNGDNQDSTKVTENTKQEVTAEEEDEDFGTPERTIVSIRQTWADKTLKVDADKSKASIKDFALAFCKAYSQCETNEAMRQYLSDPEAAKKNEYRIEIENPESGHPIGFEMYCNPTNGFIRCLEEVQTDRFTYLCYWNRKNGHKLVAAYMEECWESADWDQCLICFYDYDPATGVMTPEPSLTKMIEERMKQFELCYYIYLPEEGKDIEVLGVDSMEEDACADETFTLKWDGMTFIWEE